jgi:hypothetical protein
MMSGNVRTFDVGSEPLIEISLDVAFLGDQRGDAT